jgi:signal peptidase II
MSWRRSILAFALILGCVGCDQGTKRIAVMTLKDQAPLHYLKGTVQFLYAENMGAWGSLGANWPNSMRMLFLVVLPAIFLVGFLFYGLSGRDVSRTQLTAVALIVAGGIGNLIDRLVDGYVIDFVILQAGPLHTNVFNVADVVLMVGVGLILLQGRRKKAPEAEPPAPVV